MKKKILLLVVFVLFQYSTIYAQEMSVTGTVTDESGLPLPGVNIVVKGTSNGVQTDFDGNYKIEAVKGQVLVFSFVGLQTAEYVVSDDPILDVVLAPDAAELDAVVVTAFGIQREKNTLPYAAQQIDGEEVNQTKVGNVASGLSGKVSGLQITQGNAIGGSVNVVIRGAKSLTGNNQALFVVDGVPIDNSNTNSASQQTGGGG